MHLTLSMAEAYHCEKAPEFPEPGSDAKHDMRNLLAVALNEH